MYRYTNNVDLETRALYKECIKMCKDIGIPICDDITFSIDSAERRHGRCHWNTMTGHCDISISKYLVKTEDKKNTIIHELLHSCPDGHGHGYGWQRHADRIYRAYNIKITRCSNKEHEAVDISKSRRQYFSKAEYEQYKNTGLLVALGVVGNPEPLWYVKKNSQFAKHYDQYTSHGRKIEIKNI